MSMFRAFVAKQGEWSRITAPVSRLQKCIEAARQPQPRRQSHLAATGATRVLSAEKKLDHCSAAAAWPAPVARRFTTLSANSSVSSMYPASSTVTVVRFRRRKMHRSDGDKKSEGDEDVLTDEEDDSDSDLSAVFYDEDASFTNNYREMSTHVKSPRLDAVVSDGLGLARSKLEDNFLGSDLRLNGKRVDKKATQLNKGDYVDLVVNVEEGTTQVKRVRVLEVEPPGDNGKQKVHLRVWRSPQDL